MYLGIFECHLSASYSTAVFTTVPWYNLQSLKPSAGPGHRAKLCHDLVHSISITALMTVNMCNSVTLSYAVTILIQKGMYKN